MRPRDRSVLAECRALQIEREARCCPEHEQGEDERDLHRTRITLDPPRARLSVAFLPEIRGGLVGQHALDLADASHGRGNPAARFRAEALPGHGLDELADPEATCVPGSPTGGQDMVGPIVLSEYATVDSSPRNS